MMTSVNNSAETFFETENLNFPGPLMSAKLEKVQLVRYIQAKQQECLLDLDQFNHRKEYFFWSIMEVFFNRNGSVMMAEIAVLLFQGYSMMRRKFGRVKTEQDWCLPLAELLCSAAPLEQHRGQIIKMGDEFASREWTYAAHICYVVAQVELGSRENFNLIGCCSEPENDCLHFDAIERTEVYEYILSLTSGFGQRFFQESKVNYCNKLLVKGDHARTLEYCKTITTELLRFNQLLERRLAEKLIKLLDANLICTQQEEPQCLTELHSMLRKEPTCEKPDQLKLSDRKAIELRYTMAEKLGRGAYGTVYAGVRKSDGKEVAIKCVPKDFTTPGETDGPPLEVVLMKMVSKAPHSEKVVELLDWFETPTFSILVLERPKPSMDLSHFLKANGKKLPETMVQRIMLQVVEAAQHCCDRGVLHRDIKPGNILINPDTLDIKLIDFGCGELLRDELYSVYIGTPAYIPPEWIQNEKYHGVPATIWGLGIMLYLLACGEFPYYTFQEVLDGYLPFTSEISEECADLITRCLMEDPKDRPTFDEILDNKWIKQGRQ